MIKSFLRNIFIACTFGIFSACIFTYPDPDCISDGIYPRHIVLSLEPPPRWTAINADAISRNDASEARSKTAKIVLWQNSLILDSQSVKLSSDEITRCFFDLKCSYEPIHAEIWASDEDAYSVNETGHVSMSDTFKAAVSPRKEGWTAYHPGILTDSTHIKLNHATAAIVIVTTDRAEKLPQYINSDMDISIHYPDLVPSVFHIASENSVDSDFWPEVTQTLPLNSDTLIYDLMMINEMSKHVRFYITINETGGATFATSPVIDVEVARGRATIVQGPFLTWAEARPITIYPDFSGDFNYFIQ